MPGHPIYWGNPWFVPLYMKFYDSPRLARRRSPVILKDRVA